MKNTDPEWNLNGLKADRAALKRMKDVSKKFRVKKI
jgi:hypothetical protein